MGLAVKLGFPQPAYPLVLPASTSKNKSKNSTLIQSSPTTRKPNGSKFPSLVSVDETRKRFQIQPLIDILYGCEDMGSVGKVKSVHGLVLKSELSDRDLLVVLNHVANAYSKCSDFDTARRVFDEMPLRNIFSWTVMIVGSAESGLFLDGFKFFCDMVDTGILPDKFAYSAVVQTCIGLDCIELGEMVHAQVVERGFASDTFVSTSLLNMYAKFGMVENSCRMFNTMTEHNKVSWNAMISGLTSNGLHSEAFDQFVRMQKEGIKPNLYTLISVSKAVGKLGNVDNSKIVHSYASGLGMESSVLVGTALIDMYSKCKSVSDARSVFDLNFTSCKTNPPWNAMISGYSQSGHSQEALELFVRMCVNNIQPDKYTYCSVFNAIAALKCLHLGKEIHGMVLKSGVVERKHRVYAFLARGFISFDVTSSITKAISASSTDNYPEESIHNTLEPRDVVGRRASYWSSKGQSDPAVPEILIYKLASDLIVINEISIHPFQAFFQVGLPIYSAKAVRFQMGRAKSLVVVECDSKDESCHENKFVWTYTSEVFPMTQENRLQTFKLPEPVLCIGGILQIELLGRVQRQEMDGLFYICVSHVEVKGKPLSPAFGVEIHEPSGEFVLKNDVQAKLHNQQNLPENESIVNSTVNLEDMRGMQPIVNWNVVGIEEEYQGEEEDGSDEEYFL